MKLPTDQVAARERSAAIKFDVVHDHAALCALRALSVRTCGTAHMNASGSLDSTHILSDGRVAEFWVEFGHTRAFVFQSEKDWSNYGYMPWNIYWQG